VRHTIPTAPLDVDAGSAGSIHRFRGHWLHRRIGHDSKIYIQHSGNNGGQLYLHCDGNKRHGYGLNNYPALGSVNLQKSRDADPKRFANACASWRKAPGQKSANNFKEGIMFKGVLCIAICAMFVLGAGAQDRSSYAGMPSVSYEGSKYGSLFASITQYQGAKAIVYQIGFQPSKGWGVTGILSGGKSASCM
jgi:hypothetical protein